MFVPAIAGVALPATATSAGSVAILMAVAMGMMMVLGRNYGSLVRPRDRAEAAHRSAAAQLRAEKAAADAARHAAEIANRAKTQFFAAASHDLRQPLHAMGLFAEALRQRVHEPEVAQLVNSINDSVDALEGLFSELLDITRIDTGGVEVQPGDFEVARRSSRKLRLHFEPAAFEKGLALRFRGGQHVALRRPAAGRAHPAQPGVERDPLHRSTAAVLVSAAPRGDELLLQVWDTGLGIRDARAGAHLRGVLPGARATRRRSTATQRKGLGLGLAIVKRLARADAARRSTLRSRAGPRHGVHARAAARQGAARRRAVRLPGKGAARPDARPAG